MIRSVIILSLFIFAGIYVVKSDIITDGTNRLVNYGNTSIDFENVPFEFEIQNKELTNLVRAVRRSGIQQDATIELPRGPIGAGTHDLLVRVSSIGDAGLIAILIFDDI